jgi:photosystem II stability/assembly factor-like uncharacterized protein
MGTAVSRILILVFGLVAAVYTQVAFGQSWEPIARFPFHGKVNFISTSPKHADSIYIGAGGTLYATYNSGEDWKQLFSVGTQATVNDLFIDDDRLFLLTSKGVFESRDEGRKWNQLFHGARDAHSFSIDPARNDVLYVGTETGLFKSVNDGKTWSRSSDELGRDFIRKMIHERENEELFIISTRGLFRSIPRKQRLDRVYHDSRVAPESLSRGLESEHGEERAHGGVHAVITTSHPFPIVAIGTKEGVWVSEDEGNFWEHLPTSGLRSTNVSDLAYSKRHSMFIAATDKGVFKFDPIKKRWGELDQGLPLVRINRLALVSGETEILFAATDRGAYQIPIDLGIEHVEIHQPISIGHVGMLEQLFRAEPTVRTVQEKAIRYANVSNWKIQRWQWESRLRALVPTFSVKQDFSTSNNIDLDRGNTSTPDRYIFGPPDQSEGFDVGLTWDLSELIWNTAQTSIDSREKLMVELRDEILSEVTRIYFERRRAQVEYVLQQPADPLERITSLFRIDELTASLDALTDGYLTRELNQIYSAHPEFFDLWNSSSA